MTIAFTICSNNFLAQAKTMFQSLQRHHPEIKTYLFLADLPDQRIDYGFIAPAETIVVDEKIIRGFDDLVKRYTVIELNTAIRPFIIQYLHQKQPAAGRIYYLDPDLFIYDRLDESDRILETEDLVITPHFLQPVPIDDFTPFENLALNYGTYNMGFFGLNPLTLNTQRFLNWWGERTLRFGHIDPANGYFTDQIWFNLVPVFFDKVHSLKHPGYNMSAWNLHERTIKAYDDNGGVILSSGKPLVVYHFSSWSYKFPNLLSPYYNRYSFESRPDLVKLYKNYRVLLMDNKIEFFDSIPCALPFNKKVVKRSLMKKALMPGVSMMRRIWQKI
jgi:hypothetical protein